MAKTKVITQEQVNERLMDDYKSGRKSATQATADSDAVALMRTFELLKSELAILDSDEDRSQETLIAARRELHTLEQLHASARDSRSRQRRELTAQFHNVREMLSAFIDAGHPGLTGACESVDTVLKRR